MSSSVESLKLKSVVPREGMHTALQGTCQLATEQTLPNEESRSG